MGVDIDEIIRKAYATGDEWYMFNAQNMYVSYVRGKADINNLKLLEFYIDNKLKDEPCFRAFGEDFKSFYLLRVVIDGIPELKTMEIKDMRAFHDTVLRLHKELFDAALDNSALTTTHSKKNYVYDNLLTIIREGIYNDEDGEK